MTDLWQRGIGMKMDSTTLKARSGGQGSLRQSQRTGREDGKQCLSASAKKKMSEYPNLPLEQLVYPESALLEVLGISKEVLDTLRREKGFPCVYLDQRHRVYLAEQVLEWLEKRGKV